MRSRKLRRSTRLLTIIFNLRVNRCTIVLGSQSSSTRTRQPRNTWKNNSLNVVWIVAVKSIAAGERRDVFRCALSIVYYSCLIRYNYYLLLLLLHLCDAVFKVAARRAVTELCFGGKRAATATRPSAACACCFLGGIYRGSGRRRRHQTVSCCRCRSADPYCQQSARARVKGAWHSTVPRRPVPPATGSGGGPRRDHCLLAAAAVARQPWISLLRRRQLLPLPVNASVIFTHTVNLNNFSFFRVNVRWTRI